MNLERRRFILVTGVPRSGTTAVGKILAASAGAAYLHEPLNKVSGLREVAHYFQGPVAVDASSPTIDAQLENVLALRMKLGNGLFAADTGLRRAVKRVIGNRTRWSLLRSRVDPRAQTVIWKDPFACLLLPYVLDRHGLPSIITVRSRHAVAASFKRLNWRFNIVRMRASVEEVAPKIVQDVSVRECKIWRDNPVTNAAVLWRLVYGYLATTLGGDDRVQWVDVRRVVKDPLKAYSEMFSHVGLPLTPSVRRAIGRGYREGGRGEPAAGHAHDRRRNVQQVNEYWRSLLTADERLRVQKITSPAESSVRALLGSSA